MLTACHATMDKNIFERLPSSTNAVEFHNHLSKQCDPNILKVPLMSTYKIDMAYALEHITCMMGISTSYMDMSLAARKKRNKAANATRAKKRSRIRVEILVKVNSFELSSLLYTRISTSCTL